MELTSFLTHHAGRLEKSARRLEKNRNIEFEDALQLVLIAASDFLHDVVADLDGRFVHLRNEPEFFRAVEPASKQLGWYIASVAYNKAADASKKNADTSKDVEISTLNSTPVEFEPGIVVSDLVEKSLALALTKSVSHRNALKDVFANEGLAEYNPETVQQWSEEYERRPVGRPANRIPNEFIFKANGLSVMQGRYLMKVVGKFYKGAAA